MKREAAGEPDRPSLPLGYKQFTQKRPGWSTTFLPPANALPE